MTLTCAHLRSILSSSKPNTELILLPGVHSLAPKAELVSTYSHARSWLLPFSLPGVYTKSEDVDLRPSATASRGVYLEQVSSFSESFLLCVAGIIVTREGPTAPGGSEE